MRALAMWLVKEEHARQIKWNCKGPKAAAWLGWSRNKKEAIVTVIKG